MRAVRVSAERGTVQRRQAVAREDIVHGACRGCGHRKILHASSRRCGKCSEFDFSRAVERLVSMFVGGRP